MKRLPIILVLLLCAAALFAFDIGGSTDAYGVAGTDVQKVVTTQKVDLGLAPFSLGLTGVWTYDILAATHVIDFSYKLAYAQSFGLFSVGAALPGAQSFPIGGEASGDWFGNPSVSAGFAHEGFGIDAGALFSLKADYPFYLATEVSASYKAGDWGAFRAGMLHQGEKAVADDVGKVNAPVTVEGLSLFARATFTY